tara:strand:+ start:10405 stop:10698 length:294 start_codon:yes stop_codon:yes gene_type:complete
MARRINIKMEKVSIELFSANACNRCDKANLRIKAVVDEFGEDIILYREYDVLEKLDYAVALGILATPAIAINSELVFSGMPSIQRLRDEIKQRLTST